MWRWMWMSEAEALVSWTYKRVARTMAAWWNILLYCKYVLQVRRYEQTRKSDSVIYLTHINQKKDFLTEFLKIKKITWWNFKTSFSHFVLKLTNVFYCIVSFPVIMSVYTCSILTMGLVFLSYDSGLCGCDISSSGHKQRLISLILCGRLDRAKYTENIKNIVH